jgi:hypothetical protein
MFVNGFGSFGEAVLKEKIFVVAMFVNGSEWNEQSL